ncbi:hypothetical protein S40288_09059 [Stachybotrys chartarum IBT 40288]|nr:hypothetical protein S40288_09059 [Stachybotrys chartarum IBT 40288]
MPPLHLVQNWSVAAQLMPSCNFEPSKAEDVAGALAVLVETRTKFAVRGGGHVPVPGAANINGGVLMALHNMRTMEFAQKNTIAKLGPGLRWLDVYEWTNSHGLGVLGGRFAPVGVSGILLGGGICYFGSRFGWAVNNVAKYEVVLANSTIVNASAKENPDLFWALEGGSSNYGIATRFDIKTFPLGQVFSEKLTFSSEHLDEFLDEFLEAASAYSVNGGSSDDADGSYGPTVTINPASGNITLLAASLHIGPDPHPAAFANFSQIPTLTTTNQVYSTLSDALQITTVTGDRTQRDNALVYRFSKRFIAALEKKSKAEGNKYTFVYLNDADTSQDSFPLYGKGKSLKKMKAIRDRYDPKHIFNDLLPGGFRLTT